MATQARIVREQVARRVVSAVVGAAALTVILGATPAAAYLEPSRVQVKSFTRTPPANDAVGLSGGLGQRPARIAQAPAWQDRMVGREAVLDVFLMFGAQAEMLAVETVMIYIDGQPAGTRTLELIGRGVMEEVHALRTTVRVGDVPQPRQVQVVIQGRFSTQRTWTMML